jgi:hypothetical protein
MRSKAVLVMDDLNERPAIEVREKDGSKGIFAKDDIMAGSVIFHLRGTVSIQPTKYTIELGRDRHLNLPTIRKKKDELEYCWQYLNHSCEPSGYLNVVDLTFRALGNIAAGEELTFNYLTTESEMAEPFNCVCGSPNCFGFIRGRNFLTQEQADKLSSAMGEDKVVELFVPSARKSFPDFENSESGRRR